MVVAELWRPERVMTPPGVSRWRTLSAEPDIMEAIISLDDIMEKLAHAPFRRP
jgi:hypothetical protein